MQTVDIVVPCLNEALMLDLFVAQTKEAVGHIAGYAFSFIFVDDGSTDDTLKILKDLAIQDPQIKYLSFSRNFGKEAAIYAGLKMSTGDLTVVMDADLQDPPALLSKMIAAINEGFDCCATKRVTRKGEGLVRSALARLFYRLINKMSDVQIVDGARDFRMMTRQMVDAVLMMSEVQRFSKGIFSWVGFNVKWLEFENVQRLQGSSKWSFWQLFKYAVEGITSFSTVPLRFATVIGMVISIFSFLYLLWTLIKTLIYGIDLPGYASTLIVLLFIGGIIIMSCGVLGEYTAKIYNEVKKRPIYIVKQSNIVYEPKMAAFCRQCRYRRFDQE